MRKIQALTAATAIMAGLWGCDRLPSPPKAPMAESSSSAAVSDSTASDAPDAQWVAQTLAKEAQEIKAAPGMAKRDGDTLTISYDGKPVASFTGQYARWTFDGTIDLANPDGTKASLARVYLNDDEIGFTNIVLKDGRVLSLAEQLIVSPDGRLIASGQGNSQYTVGSNLVLWNNSLTPQQVPFSANCAPLTWHDDTHLSVQCTRDEDDSLMSVATIARQDDGSWLFTETRKLTYGDPKTFAKLKLRVERRKAEPAPTDWALAQGSYKRLAADAH